MPNQANVCYYTHTHTHAPRIPHYFHCLPKGKKMFKEIAANILLVKWNPVWRNVFPAISSGISTTSWPRVRTACSWSLGELDFSCLLQKTIAPPPNALHTALFDAFCISAGQMPLLLLCKFLAFSMSLHSSSCFSCDVNAYMHGCTGHICEYMRVQLSFALACN